MDPRVNQQLLYDAHKKSLLVAYLLWWFLGWAGAHRFYLGRTGSAIVMLMVFVISSVLLLIMIGWFGYVALGLWWLVDALLIPSIVTQCNVRLINRLQ
ncbi:MAG: TM2 domain-containing protein [Phycisphaerales bacterium]|jgi:TM2 domain-containing membrane protein YozV